MSTSSERAQIAALAASLLFVTFGPGCATPTLPLPPPAALTASAPDADGIVTITGEALEDAYVFCLNLDTEEGVIVRAAADGSFTLRVAAMEGHYLSIFQEFGTDRGPPAEIRVPAP